MKSTVKGVSFEWSHYMIPSTGSKVRTILNVSMADSGSERVTNITTQSNMVVMTIKEMITRSCLLPTGTISNKWNTVRRICILILGLRANRQEEPALTSSKYILFDGLTYNTHGYFVSCVVFF